MKTVREMIGQLLLVLLSSAVSAQAFAIELTASQPSAGAVLEKPLQGVRLWFDEAPDTAAAQVQIEGPGGSIAVQGLHSMGDDDLMAMVQAPMPDGAYTLKWTLGASSGSVAFTVKRPADFVADVWDPPLDIGVVLYDGAEPLDVFGPLEMWMNAGPDNIRVHLIAQDKEPVVLTTTSYPRAMAPTLNVQYSFADAPDLDVLMVPGGIGTLVEVDNPKMIEFLQKAVASVVVATSVCTGSALYAKAGLLEGVEATGNKVFFDYLVSQGSADWQLEARWVESGRFFTSSGVSAGIDMSLAVIARFFGTDAARMIAASTEYEWNEDPTRDPFVKYANSGTPYVEQLRKGFSEQSSQGSE